MIFISGDDNAFRHYDKSPGAGWYLIPKKKRVGAAKGFRQASDSMVDCSRQPGCGGWVALGYEP